MPSVLVLRHGCLKKTGQQPLATNCVAQHQALLRNARLVSYELEGVRLSVFSHIVPCTLLDTGLLKAILAAVTYLAAPACCRLTSHGVQAGLRV